MKILLTGGTGFIGRPLLKALLEARHEVILLSRQANPINVAPGTKTVFWNGKTQGEWVHQVENIEAVINLAGEPLVKNRWSNSVKQDLRDSRIESTELLVTTIEDGFMKPHILINASAVGYYGNVPEGEVTEESPNGKGFLSELCRDWEAVAREAETFGVRVILLRTGIVLSKNGGALKMMLPPFRFFVGGPLGSGLQWFPWIHWKDERDAILFALTNEKIRGPVNLAAPGGVCLKEFCKILGQTLHRPSWIPVPAFILRLLLGEMSDVLLEGQRAYPKKLIEAGYQFAYPTLKNALEDILGEAL
ncbi:MAG: TIGR01777 family protein [Deltaproteobacteria bacterium]|nr:TIGR01777 family protein [Deltaproteobacteria bacterium]MBI2500431.1 TIGR01777 family protein [Deltaproteobacteria bacterium]